MREYLSLSNLGRAGVLSTGITAMTVPRLVQAGLPLDLYVPATILAMLLVSGAAIAWSHAGGLRGLLPAGRVWPGMWVGLLLSLLALPYYFYAAPVVRTLLQASGNAKLVALNYPESLSGRIALVLWCGGFQTMFFYAAPMALFCRVVGHVWAAVALTVCMQVLVICYRLSLVGILHGAIPSVCASAVAATVASVLYARAGLPATMVFAAGLNAHLFVF